MFGYLKEQVVYWSQRRLNQRYIKKLGFVGVFGVVMIFGWYQWIIPNFSLSRGLTDSLPYRWFLVIKTDSAKKSIHKDDYIAFFPPSNPLYKEDTMFIKKVGGISDDKVTEKERCFYVNEELMGCAKRASSEGIPLSLGKIGVIGEGEYFVYTTHTHSFDSRYKELGWIKQDQVVGLVYPLF